MTIMFLNELCRPAQNLQEHALKTLGPQQWALIKNLLRDAIDSLLIEAHINELSTEINQLKDLQQL